MHEIKIFRHSEILKTRHFFACLGKFFEILKTRHFSTFLDVSRHFSTFNDTSNMHGKCRSRWWGGTSNTDHFTHQIRKRTHQTRQITQPTPRFWSHVLKQQHRVHSDVSFSPGSRFLSTWIFTPYLAQPRVWVPWPVESWVNKWTKEEPPLTGISLLNEHKL